MKYNIFHEGLSPKNSHKCIYQAGPNIHIPKNLVRVSTLKKIGHQSIKHALTRDLSGVRVLDLCGLVRMG